MDADIVEDGSGEVTTARNAEPARATGETPRMGIMAALRASFRPLNVRGDLAVLPSLLPHKALWVPVLVTVLTAIATTASGGSDVITPLLFTYFIVTPAVGGVFLAGFLAPRASWLLGILVSLVAAVCYIAMGLALRLPEPFQTQFSSAQSDAIVYTLVWSPMLGAFFAAAAAWYRRFLTLSNPNRGRRQQQAQKRSTDGRSRGSSNTKAPARR
jgi:phosphate/sulfate permease